MNRLDTATASSSSPPPFPRRSSTIASAPRPRTFLIWRLRRACAPSLKPNSSTTPSLWPSRSTTRPVATGTSIRSRFTFTVRSLSAPGVKTRSSTLVPDGPLIRLVAISLFTPAIERPFTAMIRSPRRIPACAAGDSSKTRSTFRPRLSCSTFMPTPSKCPLISSVRACASFAVR